jgi:Xaa-Pro aminopeptidase
VGEGTDLRLDYQQAATAEAEAVLREMAVERVGAELSWHFDPGLTPDAWQELRYLSAPIQFVDASAAIWAVRRIKSDWEIAHMRQAAEILARAHESFAEKARIGMTERQLSRVLAHSLIECGGERVPYTGVIAGLDRAPLGGPTDRPWEAGQMLGVDLCPRNGGYWADFCRIYASAEPTEAQRDAYARLVNALEAARAILRAGTPVSDVATALLVTGDNPYARAGHGLGIDMPEPPSISPLDSTPLRAGEVICLEPNIQVEGVGWLTAEEEVVVTETGCELLSPPFPAELRVIGCP